MAARIDLLVGDDCVQTLFWAASIVGGEGKRLGFVGYLLWLSTRCLAAENVMLNLFH